MINVSKQLERVVSIELSKNIIPIKVENGVLVGDILIVNDGTVKNLIRNDVILYKSVYLNAIAIRLANLLAIYKGPILSDRIYKADQEYGKWFNDSQLLRAQYQRAIASRDYEKSDIYWARYCESRDKAMVSKRYAESLIAF
jgi:hypothetical protein